jgi:hypothetical protein
MIVCLGATAFVGAGSCTKTGFSEDDGGGPATCKETSTGSPGEGCPCTFTGMKICYDGPLTTAGKGECRSGKRTCDSGVQSPCMGQVLPTDETCNLKDDDCNGKIDDISSNEPFIGSLEDAGFEAGVQCYTSMGQGLCSAGIIGCDMMGKKGCVPILMERDPDGGLPGIQDELCNGFDDDCNGTVDDVQNGGTCQIDNKKGVCANGEYTCINAMDGCKQVNFPMAETCNNKDDNCNGMTDENAPCQFGTCQNGQCFCPHVFSHDGTGFKYETTVGGVSLIGRKEHLAEGRDIEWAPMWARLDSGRIDWSKGAGSVRAKLAAAEDEIVYFDEARLTVVEHVPGWEILTSSSIEYKTLDQVDPKITWAMRTASFRTPVSASWMGRKDATASLSTYDEKAAPYALEEDNFYEIDFGAVKDASHAWIVIDGWKYKEDRHLPASLTEKRPHIDVRGADGQWRKAVSISTPRGDKKPVAFDLSTIAWADGMYRMRVYTGTHEGGKSMWYVDRVRLTEEAPAKPPTMEFALGSAQLSFTRPPSLRDKGNNSHPLWSIDDGKGDLTPEQRTWGRFTRYGDIRELLASPDDRMVVMRRGDAVEMRFDGIAKPTGSNELTLLLETDLLFKPRTWLGDKTNVRFTEEVEPMPYHGMAHYPPRGHFPSDAEHRAYMHTWQTRIYERGDPRWGE